MTVVATYPKLAHDWLKHELDPTLYRKAGIIATGAGALVTGTVLGAVLLGTALSAAKAGGNTGDGAMGAVTVGAEAQVGVYALRIIEAAANAGQFEVKDPQGDVVGIGTVGVAFAGGGISFTLADGAADFIVGDGFDITVAAGSEKYVPIDFAAVDGSAKAAAILINGCDATSADVETAVLIGQAQIVPSLLIWPAGATSQQKADALAQLAALNIVSHQRF